MPSGASASSASAWRWARAAGACARLFAATTGLPPYLDFTPDGRLFAAAFSVAILAILAFRVVPAWIVSRRDLIRGIRDGGHQASAGLARARFRLGLVGAQVLGCCALLVVAGSMARGLQHLLAADPGFTFDRLALVDPSLGRHGISGDAARSYWSEVAEMMMSHPDVERVALASPAPLGGAINQSR